MTQRVTAERVAAQQDDVKCEHDRSNADTEVSSTGLIREPHRSPGVVSENENEQQREVKKVAVDILHDERKGIFAQISLPSLGNGASGWVCPECFVVSAPVVVTGEPKAPRSPQYQKGRREQQPRWPPDRLRSKDRVRRTAEYLRRIKRRNVICS